MIKEQQKSKTPKNENRIDELVNRLKSKSPATILNETTNLELSNITTNIPTIQNAKLKSDKELDRLNKIFRAKYNQSP